MQQPLHPSQTIRTTDPSQREGNRTLKTVKSYLLTESDGTNHNETSVPLWCEDRNTATSKKCRDNKRPTDEETPNRNQEGECDNFKSSDGNPSPLKWCRTYSNNKTVKKYPHVSVSNPDKLRSNSISCLSKNERLEHFNSKMIAANISMDKTNLKTFRNLSLEELETSLKPSDKGNGEKLNVLNESCISFGTMSAPYDFVSNEAIEYKKEVAKCDSRNNNSDSKGRIPVMKSSVKSTSSFVNDSIECVTKTFESESMGCVVLSSASNTDVDLDRHKRIGPESDSKRLSDVAGILSSNHKEISMGGNNATADSVKDALNCQPHLIVRAIKPKIKPNLPKNKERRSNAQKTESISEDNQSPVTYGDVSGLKTEVTKKSRDDSSVNKCPNSSLHRENNTELQTPDMILNNETVNCGISDRETLPTDNTVSLNNKCSDIESMEWMIEIDKQSELINNVSPDILNVSESKTGINDDSGASVRDIVCDSDLNNDFSVINIPTKRPETIHRDVLNTSLEKIILIRESDGTQANKNILNNESDSIISDDAVYKVSECDKNNFNIVGYQTSSSEIKEDNVTIPVAKVVKTNNTAGASSSVLNTSIKSCRRKNVKSCLKAVHKSYDSERVSPPVCRGGFKMPPDSKGESFICHYCGKILLHRRNLLGHIMKFHYGELGLKKKPYFRKRKKKNSLAVRKSILKTAQKIKGRGCGKKSVRFADEAEDKRSKRGRKRMDNWQVESIVSGLCQNIIRKEAPECMKIGSNNIHIDFRGKQMNFDRRSSTNDDDSKTYKITCIKCTDDVYYTENLLKIHLLEKHGVNQTGSVKLICSLCFSGFDDLPTHMKQCHPQNNLNIAPYSLFGLPH